jgi:hypothetical protein
VPSQPAGHNLPGHTGRKLPLLHPNLSISSDRGFQHHPNPKEASAGSDDWQQYTGLGTRLPALDAIQMTQLPFSKEAWSYVPQAPTPLEYSLRFKNQDKRELNSYSVRREKQLIESKRRILIGVVAVCNLCLLVQTIPREKLDRRRNSEYPNFGAIVVVTVIFWTFSFYKFPVFLFSRLLCTRHFCSSGNAFSKPI